MNFKVELTHELLINKGFKLNSYTEVSPSGNGVRIFCEAQLDFNVKKKGNYEIFNSKKYATVTGRMSSKHSPNIENRQKEVEWYIKKYINVQEVNLKPTTPNEVIELALKSASGSKFRDLYDGSNIGYPSASEADSAFLYMLAFWTDKNPMLMDAIYRGSGRMRDKWVRKQSGSTWGQLEMRKACANVRETYSPETRNDFDFNK
jgi:putative DNA primase/helicase